MNEVLSAVFSIAFLTQVIRLMTPYYLAASGANFSERGGVINIAVEGFMIMAAFTFAAVSVFTGNAWLALGFSIFVNLLLSLLFGWFTVTMKINQIVTGVGFNLLIAGLTKFLMVFFFQSSSNTPRIEGLPQIPLISSIPVAGETLSDYITLFALSLVFISTYLLFRTKPGLRLRAAGENPEAAETLGVKIRRYRYLGVLICGALGALAGVWLASGQHNFSDGMTAGRGYIALAAMIIGKWKPVNIFFACLMFAAFEALEIALQISGSGLPTQLIQMLPYLITILVLIGFIGKTKPPAADGVPY